MKKNRKYLLISAIGLSCLLPLSCQKSVLDLKDTNRISEDVLFNKPSDGIQLVNAIYDSFQHNRDYMLKALFYNANFLSQDFFNWGADVSYNDYSFSTNFGAANIFWSASYIGIARANAALPIIERMRSKGVITADLANRLKGEALFLRGCLYYYLGATFGGVPLELQIVTDDGLHPRNTQDEVFASIAADMKTASELLPWKHPDAADLGRATKGAALGYLGSALMWQKKYAEAVTVYKSMEGQYILLPNYVDVHEYNKQNNAESVWEVQFSTPTGDRSDWNASNEQNWMTSFNMPEEITTFGYSYGNPLLYQSFEPNDGRKLCTILGPGDTHPSPLIVIKNYKKVKDGFAAGDARYKGDDGNIINTVGTVSKPWLGSGLPLRSGYFNAKTWRDPNATGTAGADGIQRIFGDQNVILLRYSEILLSLAEAQFKAGSEGDARATLQRVRDRGFGKLVNSSIVVPAPPDNSDFMKVLLDEYRHELSGEYSLWYNLRRSGGHIDYIKRKFGITVPVGHDLLPIPAVQIGLNPTLIQNPNY
jgi:hypothetical protein